MLGLHVVSAIVGFGSVALSGAYASTVRDLQRPGALDEARRYFDPRPWAAGAILVVPFLGAAALALGGQDGFGQLWVGAASLVWLAASAVLVGVIRPASVQIRSLLAKSGGGGSSGATGVDGATGFDRATEIDAASAESLRAPARRLAWGAAASDVAFAVAFMLMIFRPG